MENSKDTNSELIWNIVGVLAALALVFYMIASILDFKTGNFIPVSGGEDPKFIQSQATQPTAIEASPQASQTGIQAAATNVVAAANTQTAAGTPTHTPSSTDTATPTKTATATPTEDPFLLVITNYGLKAQFTLHQLQPGESYTYLADLYDTTPETLDSLNYNKAGKSLWVGQYVVIIPGLRALRADLPKFFVLQISELTRLLNLAGEHGISVEDLRYYNGLENEVIAVEMRMLLIPVDGDEK